MQTQTLDNPLQKKRVDYLDMLKCLGMFIVVSGHIHPYYGWFSLAVHCFVIPLYFFLSGMTFKRNKFPSLWEFIKHRAKTLLLPYLMFSLVTWAFWAVFNVAYHNQVNLWAPLLQTFIAQGSGGFLVHNVPLWFLPCLFVIEVLYYMIDKLPEWANITVCILLSGLGACMISWWRGPFILLPWSIESAFVSILFYGAGNWLVKQWGIDPSRFTDPLFNLLSGGMVLGACFMATDYVTSPMSVKGGIIFGVGIGFLTMMIRYFGSYPEGMSFAILIMNSVVPLLNMWFKQKKFGRK